MRFWGAHWRQIGATGGIILILAALLLWRLGSLTHGLSQPEVAAASFSSSWHHLAANPLFLPLHVVQWLILTVVSHHGATVTRLASTCYGILALLAFAYILRRWYGIKTAFYGTLLFACSAWFLHVSRFAGNDVMYVWGVPTLLALQILWERRSNQLQVQIMSVVGLAMLLYVPGMLWLVALSIGLQFDMVREGWQQIQTSRRRLLLVASLGLFMLPLVWSGIHTPSVLLAWVGLPQHFDQPIHIVQRLGLSGTYLFYRGPFQPTLWLDRQPVLGIFELVCFLLGLVFYARHFGAPRTRQLFALLVVGIVLFALQGPVTYSVVVPLVYLVVTGGVGYLLHEWLHVFPRNPLARGIGFGLMALVIALACFYNLRSYFVAWPHSKAAQSAFVKQ